MSNKQNTVIIIVGPTASGKTSLAIKLAQKFNTEIISADSRQCFKELNIGVAKPSKEELELVKHYFINSHFITESVTAQTFEQYALAAAEEIFTKNNIAIMAGGTGLYIKAFCEGLDDIPVVDNAVRKSISANYEKYGLEWLQQEVKLSDPDFWNKAEQQNPQRLMRALEVKLATGKSMLEYRTGIKKERDFNIVLLGIDISREELYRNINTRTDQMVKDGLVAEVESLLPSKNLNALQTVGYKEIFESLEGNILLQEAIEKIKQHTRNYAKRQLTWFKKNDAIIWGNTDTLLTQADEILSV